MVQAVVEAVGDRALVIAGCVAATTPCTPSSGPRLAQKAGAHALLVVSPYYNRPPQEGVLKHLTMVADSTELPVMLYDIPGRTGVAIDVETMVRAAEHEKIVAVKDAKGDLEAASWVMARSDLAWYSGEDVLNLPLMSIGASAWSASPDTWWRAGSARCSTPTSPATSRRRHGCTSGCCPVYTGIFRTQGVMTVKAALSQLGSDRRRRFALRWSTSPRRSSPG